MNLLDRRFLSISLAVNGIVDTPPDNPTVGDQYITRMNSNGFTDFTGAPNANYIARYNGSTWDFIPPKLGDLEVLDLSSNQFLRYNGSKWISVASLGEASSSSNNNDTSIIVIKGIGKTSQSTEYFGLYIANDYVEKPLGNGQPSYLELSDNDKFLSLSDNKIYTFNAFANSFSTSDIEEGQIFFNSDIHDLAFYRYDGYNHKFIKLSSIKTIKAVDRIVNAFFHAEYFNSETEEKNYRSRHQIWGQSYSYVFAYSVHVSDKAGDEATWSSINLNEGDRFLAINFGNTLEPRVYEYVDDYGDGFPNMFSYEELCSGDTIFNKQDNCLYVFDGSNIIKITGDSDQYVTVVHTLTAQEAQDQEFSLEYPIATGKENNVLCFVSGVAQAQGVDFGAFASSVSWGGIDALNNIGLKAGDTFILHYIKAED